MVFRMKNLDILGVHWKIWFFGQEFAKNQYRAGGCLKVGGGTWKVCIFKGEGLARKIGLWYLTQCTLCKHQWYFPVQTKHSKIFTIIAKILIVNVWLSSEYGHIYYLQIYKTNHFKRMAPHIFLKCYKFCRIVFHFSVNSFFLSSLLTQVFFQLKYYHDGF